MAHTRVSAQHTIFEICPQYNGANIWSRPLRHEDPNLLWKTLLGQYASTARSARDIAVVMCNMDELGGFDLAEEPGRWTLSKHVVQLSTSQIQEFVEWSSRKSQGKSGNKHQC